MVREQTFAPGHNDIKDKEQSTTQVEAPDVDGNTVAAKIESKLPVAANNEETEYSVWSTKERQLIVLTTSLASLFSPLSAQVYFPALNIIAADLQVSDRLINLSITTYMILQAIAPTFTGQISDTAGRRPAFMICFILYIAANTGLGAQDSYVALMVLRCLQSAGSSGTIALSNAVVADIVTPSERGKYISWLAVAPLLGPALGPVVGGLLAQYCGWHFIFWFLLILAAVVAIPMAIFLPETCRKIVGNGSIPPPIWSTCYTNVRRGRKVAEKGGQVPYDKRNELSKTRRVRFPNPFATALLLLQPECGYALLYSAVLSCSFYATVAAMPSQLLNIYHFNELQISLCYIPLGLGSLVAAVVRGRIIDSNFRRHAKQRGIVVQKNRHVDLIEFPIERARLEVAIPTIFLGSASTITFGWVMERHTNLAGPFTMLFLISFCLSASMNTIGVLMVDLYPGKAGTVTASNNLVRCLLGAAVSALVLPMINGIGIGWTFSIFALLNVATSPLLGYIMKQGPRWRTKTQQRMLQQESKA